MNALPEVRSDQYIYVLPDDRIARHPLEERDASRLLIHDPDGGIRHAQFTQISDELPANALLVRNNTRVIPARLFFSKESGALIELFLLNPEEPIREINQAMQQGSGVVWKCMVGNAKKWKEGTFLYGQIGENKIRLSWYNRNESLVKIEWEPAQTAFVDLITEAGETPLPPYLKRKAEKEDADRYQTVYSQHAGAVAAPTAGLHFTKQVLKSIQEKGIATTDLTLHVSAGTFQPLKSENALEHPMHTEQISFDKSLVKKLWKHEGPLVAVGTTTMRSLESMYWLGLKIKYGQEKIDAHISQHEPYTHPLDKLPKQKEALEHLYYWMEKQDLNKVHASTSIMIVPGYPFQMSDALITNFHQPQSTLILLVAAFIGENWRKVYAQALEKDYRFLSYGDSSLLWPSSKFKR